MPSRRSNRSAAVAAAVEAVEAAEGVAAAEAAEAAAAEAAEAAAAVVPFWWCGSFCLPRLTIPEPGLLRLGEPHESLDACVRPDWIAMTVEGAGAPNDFEKHLDSARLPRCRRGSAIRAELYRVFGTDRYRVPLFGA